MSGRTDLELGCLLCIPPHPQGGPCSPAPSLSAPSSSTDVSSRHAAARQIEDFPAGYPRFSALVASHPSFHICRRFATLRSRLLLLKQDRLSVLETKLEKLDLEEIHKLALGSCRKDGNMTRQAILAEVDVALADYDSFLERSRQVLRYDTASTRDVTNLKNWVEQSACIARTETAYMEHGHDLVSILPLEDSLVVGLEVLIEEMHIQLRRFCSSSNSSGPASLSRDPNVHIFAPLPIRRAVRALLAPLVTLLLLTPVIICNAIHNLTARLVVMVLATTFLVAVLSGLTKAGTMQLVVAGATYTTVLVVFISGTNGDPGR